MKSPWKFLVEITRRKHEQAKPDAGLTAREETTISYEPTAAPIEQKAAPAYEGLDLTGARGSDYEDDEHVDDLATLSAIAATAAGKEEEKPGLNQLRLSGIASMEAGNAFLPDFMDDYNARFAIVPARSEDLHWPLNLAPDRLTQILCKREQRYVGAQLTFSFERKRIMMEETEVTRGLVGRYVETYAYADGRLDVPWKGHSLPYTVFDKDQRVTHAAITENKRLGDVLAYIKERQEQQDEPVVKSNSDKNGYKPTGRKHFMNDPAVIARRQKALSRQQAAE